MPELLSCMGRVIRIFLGVLLMGLFSLSLIAQEKEVPLEEIYFNRDLELSTLEDLQIWCRSLELSDQGNINELKERLRNYYDFTLSELPKNGNDKQKTGLEIIIESAEKTEYFYWEDRGDEIHLTGGVQLTIKDPAQNSSYFLTSDSIIFSRFDDSLTALGHVRYSRQKQDGNPEIFEGESMTFHITGWKGVIFHGISSRNESVNGKEQEFYFSGSQINSSGFDVAVLKEGKISSSKKKDPEYSIRASKIWLLGPEEWGLAHGFLYLGRVPLLYLPFYYKTGNDMILNPALGYFSREGAAIQTTTYLVGQKKPVNTSFFSAGLNSETLYELERKGFFLYKGEKAGEFSEDYLKLMADWYSRLGAFAGIKGHFEQGDLFTGFAVSRSIDNADNVLFYDNQTYDYRWNHTSLGSLDIPFRWGSEFSYKRDNLTMNLSYHSDPYFMGDFMSQRQESFDPLNWLLSDKGEESRSSEKDVNSLLWEVAWQGHYSPAITKPWLTSIRIDRLKSSLQWDSRLDPLKYAEDPHSPTAYFFYPRQLILPHLGLSLSGRLWENKTQDEPFLLDNEEFWLLPKEEPPVESSENNDSSSYFMPSIRAVRDIRGNNVFSGSLGWSSSLSSLYQNNFDYDSWTGADQISLALDQGKMSLTNNNTLDLKLSLFDNILSFSHSMDYKINKRLYLDLTGNDKELTEEELKDQYSYDSIKWTQNSSLTLKPFDLYHLQGSYIKYKAAMTLFDKSYLSLVDNSPLFKETWIGQTWDSLKTSEGEAYLEYAPGTEFNVSLKGVTGLYPDSRVTSTTLSSHGEIRLGNIKNQLDHSFTRTGSDWKINPLKYLGIWDFTPLKASVSDQFTYDIEENRFSYNKTSLNFYGFNTSLVSSYTDKYHWNSTNYLWEAGTKAFQFSSLSLSYGETFKLRPLWKNRFNNTLQIGTSWNQDLIRINNSVLDFTMTYQTSIHEFLDLKFSMVSQNKNFYLYFPAMRETLGIAKSYNFWEDLAKSFNLFNINDRYESAFNLSSIKVDMIHNLGSWNGILNYTGASELDSGQFKWKSKFSFFLLWDPIPSINIKVDKDGEEKWDIRAGETEK